jgi:hypothetical protein
MDKTATPVPEKYLTGSQVEQDSTKGMTSPSYKTPGKTVRLRGVESNTDFRNSANWKSVAEPSDVTDMEYSAMGDEKKFSTNATGSTTFKVSEDN